MSLQMGEAIKALHPLVEGLSKKATKSNLLEIKNIVPLVSPIALQQLQSPLLVPLFGELIEPNSSVDFKLEVLGCAYEVLHRTSITDLGILLNLLNILMMELYDKNSKSMIRAVPEEMKQNVINCTLALIKNMTSDVKKKFYVKNNIPTICQIAYTCVQLSESEKLRTLRIRSMEVILALMQVSVPEPKSGPVQQPSYDTKLVADTFQFILPGASTKLAAIVSGDVTQGSHVIATAILTLSSMIALVMEDSEQQPNGENATEMMSALVKMSKDFGEENFTEDFKKKVTPDASGMKQMIESSQGRTEAWKKQVAKHLVPFLGKMASHSTHSSARVRREVASAAHRVLLRCPYTLKEGLPSLLDALIMLAMHEESEVREVSELGLSELMQRTSRGKLAFLDLAEENFYTLLTSLPRLVQEGGGSKCTSSLALTCGYIKLLHSSLRNILSSSAHLQRLVLSLLHALLIDTSSINVSDEYAVRTFEAEHIEGVATTRLWCRVRHSPDGGAFYSLRNICHLLSDPSCGVIEIIGPQLMDTFSLVPQLRKEAALFLNTLLLSRVNAGDPEKQNLAISVLSMYLSPDFWQSKEYFKAVTTVSKLQNDIALACLLTEGVGCCVVAMGVEKARPFLLRLLYPILERAGSAHGLLSQAGRLSLSYVSESFGHGTNIMALIAANMDYVSHHMATKLQSSKQQSGVFDALSLVLQHSSPEIAVGLQDIVLNVLQQSRHDSHNKNALAHLWVFLTFACGVGDWLVVDGSSQDTTKHKVKSLRNRLKLSEDSSDEEDTNSVTPRTGKWNAVERLNQYRQILDLKEIEEHEEKYIPDVESGASLPDNRQPHIMAEKAHSDAQETEPAEESDEKETVPELAKLLVEVLKRCIYFLPSQSIDHQFLALRTLRAGLHALQPFTNTLLPIVHQIWSPLVGRLRANQPPLIIQAAFKLLRTMAHTAHDFLSARTVQEVLPQLAIFLTNSVNQSYLQDQGSAFRFSQLYKTQLAILRGLGPLARHLELRGQDFHCILVAALPYLSSCQPLPLQAGCISLIRSLQSLDSDAVWWVLVSWWTPPHLFSILQLPVQTCRPEYKANTCLLLDLHTSDEE